MDNSEITCERVERDSLDTRYLRGELPEDLAEAFEAHFFGCDRCWTLVHGGLGAMAAMSTQPISAPRPATAARPSWRRMGGWAAAAGIAALALLYVGDRRGRAPEPTPPVMRGRVSGFAATVNESHDSIVVAWVAQPSAVRYRLTLFSATGDALMTTDIPSSRWSVAADSLARLAGGTPAWIQVEALDRLDLPVAKSPITKLPAVGRGR